MDAIRIENLTKKYKDTVAVDGLTLTVRQGELLSLLGVNGAGKTTTIKMLSTLTKPTGGEAFLHGHSILTAADKVKETIAVSPQETALPTSMTQIENLRQIGGKHGFSKQKQ